MIDPRWRENQEVLRAASGSANGLVPALEKIIESGNWREFEHPMRGVQRFDRFADYCLEFVELAPHAVEVLLEHSNFKAAAATVRRMLAEDIAPARQGSGGPVPTNSCATKVSEQSDATYVIARLKRDDPALAQQIIDGDITANAAAIRAGIRKAYARVRTDDCTRAVGVLLRHYTADEIRSALTTIDRKD